MEGSALILYASTTGNTEMIAEQFHRTLENADWSVTTVKLEPDTDLVGQQIFLDNYDLLLLGSPVVFSAPSSLVTQQLALVGQEPPRPYSNPMHFPGSQFRPEDPPLGVVFVTYSGETFGPHEALTALNIEQDYLEYLYIDVIGRFACPGKKMAKDLLEVLAQELQIGMQQASQLFSRYRENPATEEFQALSEDVQALLAQLVRDEARRILPYTPDGFSAPLAWHTDLQNRPSSRDLLKADIFLQEILEGYFKGDNLPKPTKAVYTCIG